MLLIHPIGWRLHFNPPTTHRLQEFQRRQRLVLDLESGFCTSTGPRVRVKLRYRMYFNLATFVLGDSLLILVLRGKASPKRIFDHRDIYHRVRQESFKRKVKLILRTRLVSSMVWLCKVYYRNKLPGTKMPPWRSWLSRRSHRNMIQPKSGIS